MKNCIKKLVSSLLMLIMLLSLLPASTLAADTDTVAITVSTDETRGTVTGGGTYAIGDTVTLTATAKDGYIFDGWYEDGIKLYLPKGTFIAERDRILEARFKIAVKAANAEITFPVGGEHPDLTIESSEPEKYSVTLGYWYEYWGSYTHLDADDTFEAGKEYALRFVFEANEGYAFDDAAFTVNNEPTTSYGASTHREIRVIAVTDANATYTLKVNGGSGSGDYHEWDRVTIAAEPPADNMGFREWSGLDGLEILEVVGTYQARLSPEVTFRMPAKDLEITASYGINKVEATATGNILPKLGESALIDPVFDLHNDDLVVGSSSCWRYSTDGSYWYYAGQTEESKTFRQGYWQYDFRMGTVGDAKISNPCTVTVNGEVWSTAGNNNATQIFADSPVYYLDAEGNVLPGLIRIKTVTAICADFPAALNVGDTLASFPDFTCTASPDDVVVYAHGEWQKKDGEEWKTVSGMVQAGVTYRYKTYLRMSNYNATHTLDDTVTLKVNGVEWTVDHDTRGNWGLQNAYVEVYSPEFTSYPPVTLVNVPTPYPGMQLDGSDIAAQDSDKHLCLQKYWYDVTDGGETRLSNGAYFQNGHTYQLRVVVRLLQASTDYPNAEATDIPLTLVGVEDGSYTVKKTELKGAMWACDIEFQCTREDPDITPVRPTGNGTWSDPFYIYNVGELYWFAGLVNGTVEAPSNLVVAPEAACARLMKDITVNQYVMGSIATRDFDLVEWTPIGQTAGYSGIFEGERKTVSGIYCQPESGYAGLFGTLNADGCICDLTLADSYVASPTGEDRAYAGGIVGEIKADATVKNCHFDGAVLTGDTTGTDTVGGISAVNRGEIRNCTVKGTLAGYATNAMGGIVGSMVQGSVVGCVNEATVENLVAGTGMDGDATGGIVGTMANGTLRDCCNKGEISGNNSGGIVGMAGWGSGESTAITRCWNEGTVEAGAGIVHWLSNKNVTVKNCYNTGSVRYGIVNGYTGSGHSVTYCHNVGELTAGSENGAPIIAKADSDGIEIENCYYMADSELDEIDGTYDMSGTMFGASIQAVYQMLNRNNEGNWVQGDNYPVLTDYVSRAFEYIAITTPPDQVNYLSGEHFDPTGMVVTAYYDDGTSRPVTDYTVTNGNNLTSSSTSVNILYQEEGITQLLSQPITVEKRTYQLTVVGASGSGAYEVGAPVSLSAGYVPTGKTFAGWTADGIDLSELTFTLGDPTSANITFIMPAKDFTLTPVIEDVLYQVTVVNGILENGTTSGGFKTGEEVVIIADPPEEGMMFEEWTTSIPLRFGEYGPRGAFVMPGQDITVTAVYEETHLIVGGEVFIDDSSAKQTATVTVSVEYLDTVEGLDPTSGAMLIVAQYNGDYRLTDVKTLSVKADGQYTAPVFNFKEDYDYLVYLVDAETLTPLCEPPELLWGGSGE